MRQRSEGKGGKRTGELDRSGLLSLFLLGQSAGSTEGLVEGKTTKLMERPKRQGYNVIAERESKGTLNSSQAKAARAILSPLREGQGEPIGNDDEWHQQERLILIHGRE